MADQSLITGAHIAAAGKMLGLSPDETVSLFQQTSRRNPKGIDVEERRKGEAFDFNAANERRVAAGLPPVADLPDVIGGFGYNNPAEDIAFGLDQADDQYVRPDDKNIEGRVRRRAKEAIEALEIEGNLKDQRRVVREAAIAKLAAQREAEQAVDGRTDWRMQQGSRIKEDPFVKGKRGADHNLIREPGKVVRRFGRERYRFGQEPQFINGFENPNDRDARMRAEIAAERREARKVAIRADAQAAGQLSDTEMARRIRRAEINANANNMIEGMAPNSPFSFILDDISNEEMEEIRREGIEAAGVGQRQSSRSIRGFESFGADAVSGIRAEQARRAAGGEIGILRQLIANEADAGLEAKLIALRGGLNQNMGMIPDIRDVGNLKMKLPVKAGGFNEGQYFPEATQRGNPDGPFFDARGLPIGVQGPIAPNTSTTANSLNAPQTVRQWAIQNAPNYRDGGRIFGDFPQVAAMDEGDAFLARLANVKKGRGANAVGYQPINSHIRGIDALQAEVDNFIGFAGEQGIKLFNRAEGGKEQLATSPGLPAVFQKVKMNNNAQNRLANAVFQIEAARRGEDFQPLPDRQGKGGRRLVAIEGENGNEYRVVRDTNNQIVRGARVPEFGNDEAQLQKVGPGNIQVGVNQDGSPRFQDRVAALQQLSGRQAEGGLNPAELRDARNGLMGAVIGEGRGNFGFAKPLPEGVSESDDRQFFMDQAKERAKGKPVDVGRVNRNVQRRREILANAANPRPNQVLGVMGTAEKALREKESMVRNEIMNRGIVKAPMNQQAATSAVVNPRSTASPIISDPWEAQAPAPRVLSGGGNAMQAPTKPILALPYGAGDNPFGVQGPAEGSLGRRAYSSVKNFMKSPQNVRGRRIAYGIGGGTAALAGLSALIDGEREQREQGGTY